jgi:hypothetical protein
VSTIQAPDGFTTLPDEQTLAEIALALEAHGFAVDLVDDLDDAREAVLARIPEGSSVTTNTSVTLQETGIAARPPEAETTSAPIPRYGMDGIWREILDDARWAPSPHNTQPWLVRVLSAEAAELYAPRERLLPVEDPEGRFEMAAQGIFLEALNVAAGKRGLTVETEPLFPWLGVDADERPLVARLRLGRREEPARFDAQLLQRRRTSRLPYDGRPVDEQARRALRDRGGTRAPGELHK